MLCSFKRTPQKRWTTWRTLGDQWRCTEMATNFRIGYGSSVSQQTVIASSRRRPTLMQISTRGCMSACCVTTSTLFQWGSTMLSGRKNSTFTSDRLMAAHPGNQFPTLLYQRRKRVPPLRLHLLRRQTSLRMNQCSHSWRREPQSSMTGMTIS
jgi:hypothetical protein